MRKKQQRQVTSDVEGKKLAMDEKNESCRNARFLMRKKYFSDNVRPVNFAPNQSHTVTQYKAFRIPKCDSEASEDIEDTNEDIITEKDTTEKHCSLCSLCEDNYANTRLECGHEICSKCTKRLYSKGHFETISCPYCRKECKSCKPI